MPRRCICRRVRGDKSQRMGAFMWWWGQGHGGHIRGKGGGVGVGQNSVPQAPWSGEERVGRGRVRGWQRTHHTQRGRLVHDKLLRVTAGKRGRERGDVSRPEHGMWCTKHGMWSTSRDSVVSRPATVYVPSLHRGGQCPHRRDPVTPTRGSCRGAKEQDMGVGVRCS